MSLPTPVLDDRSFQSIVDEAKKRIPQHCEEWTDHNVSDPGITLVELFAWMTEMIMYRMNQVPQLHYIKLMEMLGVRLQGPVPAEVPISFWLTAPQENPVLLPAGTEVASTQTETERPIIFTTDDDFRILPPQLTHIFSRVATETVGQSQYVAHDLRRLQAGFEGIETFSSVPQVGDALYFGFENDVSNHILGLEMACDVAGGAGIDPTIPPYVWEAATGQAHQRWQACDVDMDTTQGLNSNGRIQLHLPKMRLYRVNGETRYWVRLRIKEISSDERAQGMRPYEVSPKVQQITAAAWGGTTLATHAQVVRNELLGRSDGLPGQRFRLRHTPVLAREAGERLVVEIRGQEPQLWTEVADFADSRWEDRHYTLDAISGELRFGPAIRQPDETMRRYGAVPPRLASVIMRRYRTGGGVRGNVDTGVINTLKTAVPYIARVANRQPAKGGRDAETLEAAMMRVPALLRSRSRAVTESDFEYLALQALPDAIARVRCLQARSSDNSEVMPGQVYVLVVPRVRYEAGYLAPDELRMSEDNIASLTAYLNEHRLLTTRLNVRTPAYRWVSARVVLGADAAADRQRLEAEVMAKLYAFLNPLTGGPDGTGWPFGRDLFVGDVYQTLQGIDGILFTRTVELYAATPGGPATGDPVDRIDIVAHGVVASGVHTVEFV
jgi:predicted phage baseplate assembly protein